MAVHWRMITEGRPGAGLRIFRFAEDALPRLNFLTKKAPYKGLGADSEEKHEPVSDIEL
jgi:hypothetical protein